MNFGMIFPIVMVVVSLICAFTVPVSKKKKKDAVTAKFLFISGLIFSSAALFVMIIALARKGEPLLFFILAEIACLLVYVVSLIMIMKLSALYQKQSEKTQTKE